MQTTTCAPGGKRKAKRKRKTLLSDDDFIKAMQAFDDKFIKAMQGDTLADAIKASLDDFDPYELEIICDDPDDD